MTTKIFKRLPYGISNFESIRTENYYYVDKTRCIELLEKETNPYHFFIRPRKFGKSLFFSMLQHYYDINRADKFARLFGDLYIGKNPTPRRNNYCIIDFDFSGINTSSEESFRISFFRNVEIAVSDFIEKYRNIFADTDALIQKINEEKPGIDALRIAYGAVQTASTKMFVLIDEYDHFANDLIAMGSRSGDDVYRRVIRANGIVRDFYETLKIGTKSVLDRIFITGISPVMLDDLTSGFNIAANLSLERQYNEMSGFTQEEMETLMDETGVDPALIKVDMKRYYDGYLFHPEGEKRVYNPSMVLYFFDQILRDGKPPKKIVDDNLKTDYGRLQRLVQNEDNRRKLLEIVKENGIISDIASKFSIDRLEDNQYFVSLLFYMGMLTIDSEIEGSTLLRIPNYSVKTIYWEYIERLTVDLNKDVTIDFTARKAAIRELAYRGNPIPYVEYVSKNIFGKLSNRDLMHFDEKYIKIMLLDGLFQSNIYVPLSEYEIENGYVDMYLQRNPLLPDVKYEWVWEIKYLRKENESQSATKLKEAVDQAERYSRSARFKDRTDVKYVALLFIGKTDYVLQEIDK